MEPKGCWASPTTRRKYSRFDGIVRGNFGAGGGRATRSLAGSLPRLPSSIVSGTIGAGNSCCGSVDRSPWTPAAPLARSQALALGVDDLMSKQSHPTLAIGDRPINLTQVLKLAGWVMSGGEAKSLIAEGQVSVNGEIELRKRRQMRAGDVVTLEGGPSVELQGRDAPVDT